jgi:hypothetical protein
MGVFYILPVRKRAGVHLKMMQRWIWFPRSRAPIRKKNRKIFRNWLDKAEKRATLNSTA